MRKIFTLVLVLGGLFAGTHVNAQTKGWRLGIAAMPGVATNGGYGFVFGADVRLQTIIADKTAFTLTTGITQFFKKSPIDGMGYIPVKPGIKYFLGDNLYVGGEVGIGFGMVKNSGRSFIWAPSIGLSFDKIDISVKYEDASDFHFNDVFNTKNNYTKQFALRIARGFSLK